MPRSSRTEFASPAHAAAYTALTAHFQHRAVSGTDYHLGPVYSQVYPSGPVAWRVSLHTDDRAGQGKYAAQMTIECRRTGGTVAVFGEPRRNPKTGDRYAPAPAHLDFLARLTPKVEARLAGAEGYADPDPQFRIAAPVRKVAPAPDDTIFDLFGGA